MITRYLPLIPSFIRGALWCYLIVVLFSSSVYAASFDCNAAGTRIEKMICSDEEVSSLDERLGAAYKNVRSALPNDNIMKVLQRQWIKNIRNKVNTTEELRFAYRLRVSELEFCCTQERADDVSWVLLPIGTLGRSGPVQGEITTYPYLTKTMEQDVTTKVNALIDEKINNLYCSENSREDFVGSPYTLSSSVSYSSNYVFSINGSLSYYCGGAYPVDSAAFNATFDLRTGKTVTLGSMFRDFEINKPKIYANLFREILTDPSQSHDCSQALSVENLIENDQHDFYITKTGLVISPNVSHALASCVYPVTVDMDRMRPYFSPYGILGLVFGFPESNAVSIDKGVVKPDLSATLLTSMLTAVARSWGELKNHTPTSQNTAVPKVGIRGRYHALSKVMNINIIEELVGLPLFLNDTHTHEINWNSATSFGHYNPQFLTRLHDTLSAVFDNGVTVSIIQPFYDSQLKRYLRTYLNTYYIATKNDEYVKGYLKAIEQERQNPGSSPFLRAPSLYIQNTFGAYAENMANRGYDVYESTVVPGFWLRRKVDGTAEQFHTLLKLMISTFDSGYYYLNP